MCTNIFYSRLGILEIHLKLAVFHRGYSYLKVYSDSTEKVKPFLDKMNVSFHPLQILQPTLAHHSSKSEFSLVTESRISV